MPGAYQGGQLPNHTHGTNAGDGGSLATTTTLLDSNLALVFIAALNQVGL